MKQLRGPDSPVPRQNICHSPLDTVVVHTLTQTKYPESRFTAAMGFVVLGIMEEAVVFS